MNRTLKEATVKRYHYESHASLQEYLDTFVNAYNSTKVKDVTMTDAVQVSRQKLAGAP